MVGVSSSAPCVERSGRRACLAERQPPFQKGKPLGEYVIRRPFYILAFVALGVACKPKAGDSCKPGEGACSEAPAALVCVDGKLAPTTCKGADGCTPRPFRCDFRGNAPGDPCIEAEQGATYCGPGWKSRVTCVNGKVAVEQCDGPAGCYADGTSKGCDRIRKVGADCTKRSAGVDAEEDFCSSDKRDWLQCRAGKYALVAHCRGTGGCRSQGDVITCDTSVGELGDACVGKFRTCSTDVSRILRCDGSKLGEDEVCGKGKACRVQSGEPSCAPL